MTANGLTLINPPVNPPPVVVIFKYPLGNILIFLISNPFTIKALVKTVLEVGLTSLPEKSKPPVITSTNSFE